jgi:hypothetical protein
MGRTWLTAVTLATTLAIAGCGSSAKPLTRAELTSKANAICRKVAAKLVASTKGESGSQQALARIAPELATFEQSALTELSKLMPPADLSSEWKEFVAGAETLAESTAKLGEYAKANNLTSARSLILSAEKVQAQMQATAKHIGLADCEQVA